MIPKFLTKVTGTEYIVNNHLEIRRDVHYIFLKLIKNIFVEEGLEKYIISINKEIKTINMDEYNKLLIVLEQNSFLEKSYNEILDMLFDFIEIIPNIRTALTVMQYKSIDYDVYGISTCSFEDIKTFYMDAYEKILSLIHIPICLDNIKYRNKYDLFDSGISFEDFMKKKKGNKLKEILRTEFFSSMLKFPVNNKLRNAIGHRQYEYDGIIQIIKYIPNEKNKEVTEKKYLLEVAIECVYLMQYMVIIEDLIFQLIVKKNLNRGLKLKLNDIFYKNIGVNERCPCGSGKKYKKCCKLA